MKIVSLKGQISLITGLHIGGGDDVMKIGGIDNQVIKDTLTNKPYIPGSSIKGKLRSLLEWDSKVAGYNNGNPFGSNCLNLIPQNDMEKAQNLIKLFGDSASESKFGFTRISIGDCFVSSECCELTLSEAKYENVIDRISGTAKHPRQIERVPAGIKFDYDIRIKILDSDDEGALKGLVTRGLELIERDYLGGSGSRGYGRVEFSNKTNWY